MGSQDNKRDGDSYLKFEQAKDALQNIASTISSEVASGVSSVARRGSVDVKKAKKSMKSVASAASSEFSSAAKRGSADVLTVADNAISSAKKVAELSTDGFRETSLRATELATRGTDEVFQFAEQGFTEIQLLSRNGTEKVGEVAKWIDAQAKSSTEFVSFKAKALVLKFTGKEDYNFGDITNELIRRIAQKEIATQDTILLIKILIALGASIGPLAKALPLTILLEALNVSLEQKVGGQVLETLALAIDSRIIAAFSSDDKVQIGDALKRTVLSGVLAFTGKKSYESGDIVQRVVQQKEETETDETTQQLKLVMNPELQEWDRLFVERCLQNIESTQSESPVNAQILDMKISSALEVCADLEKDKTNSQGKGIMGARDRYFDQL